MCSLVDDAELLQHSNELVVKKKVIKVQALQSKRSFYRVKGSAPSPYLAFTNYCTCPAFLHTASKASEAFCKHSLAVVLAEALNQYQLETISEAEYASKLQSIVVR